MRSLIVTVVNEIITYKQQQKTLILYELGLT